MKLSKYNYYYIKDDNVLIINMYSGCIVLLSLNEYEELEKCNQLNKEKLIKYEAMGIVIDDDVDEWKLMRFDDDMFKNSSISHYRILTTTGCNAQCEYCYEAGIKPLSMDEIVSEKVVKFIESNEDINTSIHIEWFGGEPLINITAIKNICKKLTEDGYSIQSSIVTNGIFLSEENIRFLKNEAHVEKMQISLDGTEHYYEKIKHVPKGTFINVINNIIRVAAEDITVYVRLNLGNNMRELENLINYAKKEIGFNRRIFWYIHPIFEGKRQFDESTIYNLINLNKNLVKSGLMKMGDLYKFPYRKII